MSPMMVLLGLTLAAGPAPEGARVFAPGAVSTGAHEGPFAFTPDGETVYFLRLAAGMARPRFFVSHRVDGRWTAATPAKFPGDAEAAPFFISTDGARLYYTHTPDATRRSRLWVADRDGDGWKNPRPAGGALEKWDGDQYSPSTTADGTLYFTSKRAQGAGGWDVYRAALEGGQYAEPKLLGGHPYQRVSTLHHEASATVSADGKTLVFSSANAPNGRGGADLYFAELQPAGRSPVYVENLGTLVNTAADEIDPRLSADGKRLYFVRSGDIYEIELEKARSAPAGSEKWQRIAESPSPREWPQLASVRGKIYVYGGLNGVFGGQRREWQNHMEVFDPAAKTWDAAPAIPEGWTQATLVAFDDRLFLFRRGGPGVAEYQIESKRWEVKPAAAKPFTIGGAPPFWTRTAMIGRKAYTMYNGGGARETSYFVEYDFDTGAWTPRRSMPFPAPQLAALNGRIYSFAGGERPVHVSAYDPASDEWSEAAPMDMPRWESAVVARGGEVWLIGGHGIRSDDPMDGDITPTVVCFDPQRNRWREGPPLPWQLAAAGAIEVDGRLFVMGGIRPGPSFTHNLSVLEYVGREGD
jgi:hypothetical protein